MIAFLNRSYSFAPQSALVTISLYMIINMEIRINIFPLVKLEVVPEIICLTCQFGAATNDRSTAWICLQPMVLVLVTIWTSSQRSYIALILLETHDG